MLNHTKCRLRYATIAAMLLVPVHTAFAKPITVETVTADVSKLGNGLFQYTYTLKSPRNNPQDIVGLSLFFDGDSLNVRAPKGWNFTKGAGFIDWFSVPGVDGVLEGKSLGGFSFQSAFSPDLIKFQGSLADSLKGDAKFQGTTTGPTATPEPPTLWLVATAGLFAMRVMRNRAR
jgi:hypothetical protein